MQVRGSQVSLSLSWWMYRITAHLYMSVERERERERERALVWQHGFTAHVDSPLFYYVYILLKPYLLVKTLSNLSSIYEVANLNPPPFLKHFHLTLSERKIPPSRWAPAILIMGLWGPCKWPKISEWTPHPCETEIFSGASLKSGPSFCPQRKRVLFSVWEVSCKLPH